MLLKVIKISIICLLVLHHEASAVHMVRKLPEPLKPYMSVKIDGDIVTWTGRTFHIDFQEAWEDAGGDTYLHMSVRFAFRQLVFNTWINGTWGDEEIYDSLPERLGRADTYGLIGYEINITARDDDFHITLNGREYTFKYRMPKEDLGKIKFVAVSGDFNVNSLEWS